MRSTLLLLVAALAVSGCSNRAALDEKQTEIDTLRENLDAAYAEIERLEEQNTSMDRQLREAMDEAARPVDPRGETIAVLQASEIFSGPSDLSRDGTDRLAALSALLRAQYPDQTILIEGHSDADPIRTFRYPSNWDLATARASAVAHYFEQVQGIEGTRMRVVGYAEFDPVAGNDTPEGRQQNRRVRIAVLAPEVQ